jgi:integrase
MGKLSDVKLRAWVRAGKPIAGKADGDGLTFTLSKNGTAAWVLRYRHASRQREITLGRYPDLGLAAVRIAASKLRLRVTEGEDVSSLRQAERARGAIEAHTFDALAREWLGAAVGEKYAARVRRTLERYAFPTIGKLAPNDVHPQHIDRVLRAVVDAGSPTTANDLLRLLKRIFAFARKRRITNDNPAADFNNNDAGGKETARDRALNLDEVRTFFSAMKNCPTLGRDNELAFRLLLLLGVRKAELVCAAWSEFDLAAALWKLPASRSKTGAGVTIPLPMLAVRWLEELRVRAAGSPWVFPARRVGRRDRGHISGDTLNVALSRVTHTLPHFTVHDLRRTTRTQLAALGIAPHVAERVLNHKLRGVAGVYDRHDYLPERRRALEQWAGVLEAIETGGQVVPLHARRTA